MSYAGSLDGLGKEPFQAIGLVLDKCTRTAGVAPCTAAQTGDAKCYNTIATCNDTANYNRGTVEYKFCQPTARLPIGENLLPALDSAQIQRAPTSITSGKGMGNREVVKFKIKDFVHHDRGIDPYWSERTYNAETVGTFWPRFLRRNPYFEGRAVKIYSGFLNNPFSWADFEVEAYDITDISGPNKGAVEVTAKDALIRTYGEKTMVPALSVGTLLAALTDVATTATISPASAASSYPASGYLSVGDEIMGFTRSSAVLTLSRGQWGTTAAAHDAGDLIQVCEAADDENVVDFLARLFTTYIPAIVLDTSGWDAERDEWLSSSVARGIISKPTAMDKIIGELSESFMFDLWWDAVGQVVKLKALAPPSYDETPPKINDSYNILNDSLSVKRDPARRITQVHVWYNKINHAGNDDLDNYTSAQVSADIIASDSDHYASDSIRTIKSRWIASAGAALQLAGRTLARFSSTPELIAFDVPIKDYADVLLGENIDVTSWQFTDFSGAAEERRFQITEKKQIEVSHSIRITAMSSIFSGRYFRIAPNSMSSTTYSAASDDERERYGFICYNSDVFLDGTQGYKVL
jgi:hypothetical protein